MNKQTRIILIIVFILLFYLVGSGKIDLTGIFATAGITTEKILPVLHLNKEIKLNVISETTNISEIYATIDNIRWPINVTPTGLDSYEVLVNTPRAGILNVFAPPTLYKVEIRRPIIKIKDNIPLQVDVEYESDFIIETLNPQNEALDADAVSLSVRDPDNIVEAYQLEELSGNKWKIHWKYVKTGIYFFEFSPEKPTYDTEVIKKQTNVMPKAGIDYFWYAMGGGLAIIILLIIRKRYF